MKSDLITQIIKVWRYRVLLSKISHPASSVRPTRTYCCTLWIQSSVTSVKHWYSTSCWVWSNDQQSPDSPCRLSNVLPRFLGVPEKYLGHWWNKLGKMHRFINSIVLVLEKFMELIVIKFHYIYHKLHISYTRYTLNMTTQRIVDPFIVNQL